MRKVYTILYMLPLLLCLSGCGLTLDADRHDVERLLLIQTMGLDSRGDGMEMSISSGLGVDDKPALVMSSAAVSIEDAIARLQNYSPENQLFYAHVQYLLLGEDAARDELVTVLKWIERSPVIRMETSMMVVQGSAKEAVVGSSQESTDITQRLMSLDRASRTTGWTVYSLREIAAALAEGHGALCLAVETVSAEDTVFTQEMSADAVIPAGYAILCKDGLLGFLSPEESLGAELLTGDPTGIMITVDGNTLEILEGSAEASGKFSADGKLEGIDVQCTLRTGLLEKTQGSDLSPEKVDSELSDAVAQWLAGALEQAQTLECDFLGVQSSVLKTAKEQAAYGEQWNTLFPTVPISVTVDGAIDKSYDLSE